MTRNEIVVGLDDSPSSKAALSWAAEQAIRTHTVLRAVHALDWPYGAAYVASITKVFDDIAPRPDWLLQFAKGEPGAVLVRQSGDAQLLVVGTREHVGLGRLLVGSISHYCLSHAVCPVVAVPVLTHAAAAELFDQGIAGEAAV
jgi:nucleotide-binding universal stress UspA family protein